MDMLNAQVADVLGDLRMWEAFVMWCILSLAAGFFGAMIREAWRRP